MCQGTKFVFQPSIHSCDGMTTCPKDCGFTSSFPRHKEDHSNCSKLIVMIGTMVKRNVSNQILFFDTRFHDRDSDEEK
jgi:hypothetical protein